MIVQATNARRTFTTQDALDSSKANSPHDEPAVAPSASQTPADVAVRHEFFRWIAKALQKKQQRTR
jgi:hypothetical protein